MRISDYPECYWQEVASATLTEENRARDRFRAYQRNLKRREEEAREVIEANLPPALLASGQGAQRA